MSFACSTPAARSVATAAPMMAIAVAQGHMMHTSLGMLPLAMTMNRARPPMPLQHQPPPPPLQQPQEMVARKHRHDDEELGKMFVGGLSWDTTQESLLRYFSRFGEVVDCVVMKNAESGRSRGFGFVTYSDPSNIYRVLASCPHTLDGRTIDPKACNPRSMQKPKKSNYLPYLPKVFLGGLPSSITETDLRNFFSRYGEVCEVVIMYDQEKKKSRGFGFLSFVDEVACVRAVAQHFVTIHNKQVEIKRAEPRTHQLIGSDFKLDAISGQEWAMLPPSAACQPLASDHNAAPAVGASRNFSAWSATPSAGAAMPPPAPFALSPAVSLAPTQSWGPTNATAVPAHWPAPVAVAPAVVPRSFASPPPAQALPQQPPLPTKYAAMAFAASAPTNTVTPQPAPGAPHASLWASSPAGLTPPPPTNVIHPAATSLLPRGHHISEPMAVSATAHQVTKLAVAYPGQSFPAAMTFASFPTPPPSASAITPMGGKLPPSVMSHANATTPALMTGPAFAPDFFTQQSVNANGPLVPTITTAMSEHLGPQRGAVYTQQSQVQSYHPYRRT